MEFWLYFYGERFAHFVDSIPGEFLPFAILLIAAPVCAALVEIWIRWFR